MNRKYRFYMDETDLGGFPFQNLPPRHDGLNCFCCRLSVLGIIAEEDIEFIRHNHKMFCAKWGIDYPLHYNAIRSRSGNFKWLKAEKGATNRDPETFVQEYHDFMAAQPYKVYGFMRNKNDNIFVRNFIDEINEFKSIVFKDAIGNFLKKIKEINCLLSFYIEKSGKKEDKLLISIIEGYIKNIKTQEQYKNANKELVINIQGTLSCVDKSNPFTQVADFCAYAMAKAMKDKSYRPYAMLKDAGKFDFDDLSKK